MDYVKNRMTKLYLQLLKNYQTQRNIYFLYKLNRPMLGNQHTMVLSLLENLCSHEETVVR